MDLLPGVIKAPFCLKMKSLTTLGNRSYIMKLGELKGNIDLDKVRKVLESDIPSNQLEIITGIPRMTISRYRKDGYDLSNIKLAHLLSIANKVEFY